MAWPVGSIKPTWFCLRTVRLLYHIEVNAGFGETVEVGRDLGEKFLRWTIREFHRVRPRSVEFQRAAEPQKPGYH